MCVNITAISFEFRCNGSGDAKIDITIALSNYSYHSDNIYHVFSLTKRCGDCHSNRGIPGK